MASVPSLGGHTAYGDSDNCRTSWNIILSCFITIFVCSWVAIRPDVPYPMPNDKHTGPIGMRKRHLRRTWIFFRERLSLVALLLVFPELVLARALRQYYRADSLSRTNGWTRQQAFFIVMGGFHFFDPRDDKGKTGTLTVVFSFVHTFWFLTQCIARAAQSIPVTKLELLTSGYTIINAWLYWTWRDKPRNIKRPILISSAILENSGCINHDYPSPFISRVLTGFQGIYLDMLGVKELKSIMTAHLIGAVFAGILCVAWSYNASSSEEFILWRLCSLSGPSFCLLGFTASVISAFADSFDMPGHKHFLDLLKCILLLLELTYVATRIVSVALAIMELNAPPLGIFEDLRWTNFIPHV